MARAAIAVWAAGGFALLTSSANLHAAPERTVDRLQREARDAPGRSARVSLDPAFVRSLRGEVLVRVIALNEAPATMRMGTGPARELVASGARWRVSEFRLPAAELQREQAGTIEIKAGAEPLTLHMLEVRRSAGP